MIRQNVEVEEIRVTASELAVLLRLSRGRVSQLTGSIFERDKNGLFDLSTSLIAYERYLWHGARVGPRFE